MICPYCAADNDKVIDSRAAEGGAVIRRRRECLACHKRFTTYERIEKTARLVVIKRDGARTPFDTDKVLAGVQAACGKRAIPEEDKLRLVHEVEEELHRDFDREVDSQVIGERVAQKLRELDEIAYIRYASEYRQFRSLDEFEAELNELRSRVRNLPNQQELFAEG